MRLQTIKLFEIIKEFFKQGNGCKIQNAAAHSIAS
jgi:hypothetical protein